MIVSRETKYDDKFIALEKVFETGEKKRLRAAAVKDMYGDAGFWSLTIGEMFALMDGDVRSLMQHDGDTVYDVYRCKAFEKFADDFVRCVDALTLKATAAERANTQGCKAMTFKESTLIFVRRYFGLHSFIEAEGITLADYIIAKKDDYNASVVERNIANKVNKR